VTSVAARRRGDTVIDLVSHCRPRLPGLAIRL